MSDIVNGLGPSLWPSDGESAPNWPTAVSPAGEAVLQTDSDVLSQQSTIISGGGKSAATSVSVSTSTSNDPGSVETGSPGLEDGTTTASTSSGKYTKTSGGMHTIYMLAGLPCMSALVILAMELWMEAIVYSMSRTEIYQ